MAEDSFEKIKAIIVDLLGVEADKVTKDARFLFMAHLSSLWCNPVPDQSSAGSLLR